MSARSYHDARKVVKKIDEEEDPEIKEFLESTLNKSVNAATKFIDKPADIIKEAINRASGDTKNACVLVDDIENEVLRKKANLPNGKFQCIYLDLSQPFKNLAQFQLQEIGSQDSVLFLWVTPTKLESAFPLIRKWGYKYKTCMLWDIMQNEDVTEYGEILLIATRGKINLMVKSKENVNGPEKPQMVKDMIMSNYSGDKLEIMSDGYRIWKDDSHRC